MMRFFAPFLLCSAASLLVGCGPPTPPANTGTAGNPYAGGRQYPWTDRLEAAVANPYAAGRSYPWTSPTAFFAPASTGTPGSGQNFLSALPWTSATNGWGPVERDRSNGEQNLRDGKPLTIASRTFKKGLGVHALSEIRYALGGQCSAFSAVVGLDQEVGKRGSARFRVYGDNKVIFDSQLRRGGQAGLPVGVSVAGVRELRLQVSDGGDNFYYDHADWGDAAVKCAVTPSTGSLFLSDLPYVSASNGWGPVEFNRSNGEQAQADGRPLTIGGRVFNKGLGVHSPSTLRYALDRVCTGFTASVGLDDEVGDRGSVGFEIHGDGAKLYSSGVMGGRDAARQVKVNLSGVQTLTLGVTDGGDNINFDRANWADAHLDCGGSVTGKPGTLDASFGSAGRVAVGGVDVVAEPGGVTVVLDANFALTRLSRQGTVLARGQAGLLSGVPDSAASALVRQPDGKLLAVGYAGGQMAALRYHPNLSLDTGFGQGGLVRLRLGVAATPYDDDAVRSAATDAAVQPDGGTVLVGHASRPFSPLPGVTLSDRDFAVVRLDSSGAVDTTFGTDGVTYTALNTLLSSLGESADQLFGVALQPDGKIVAVGEANYDTGLYSAVVARYRSDGRLDTTFSQDGLAFSGLSDRGTFRTVALEPGGGVVAGGGAERFFTSALLQRFGPDGVPGAGVKFDFRDPVGPLGDQTIVTSVLLQDDGSIVLGGYQDSATYVSHFSAALMQDLTFGGAPRGHVPVSAGRLIALTQDSDHQIIATTAQATAAGIQGQGTFRLFR